MTSITLPRATVEQALEALEYATPTTDWSYMITALRAALAQEQTEPDISRCPQCNGPADNGFDRSFPPSPYLCTKCMAEPVAGKVVAWGVFANIDGEWQLQHPVFAGDEQGKVNAEFERASYSGPQPLEVRPLGVVTATAQQAEPVAADALTEPKSGDKWRVEWWNESCRMMLPAHAKLDSFVAYKNGTIQFTIKRTAA